MMKIQTKICPLFIVLLLIVVQSTSPDPYTRKGSSALDRKYYADNADKDDKYENADNDYSLQSTYRRNRYSPYDSPTNNYRTRSRWTPSYDDSNDWSRFGYGPNGLAPNFPPSLPPAIFDSDPYLNNGPNCYSLLDSQYPLFSDICGAVPQARYSLPNSFGHVERWQVAQTLTAILGSTAPPSANPSCTRSLRLLLCPLLFPPCPTRYEAPPVLPCQPFCRIVKNQCASPSLELLPCDLLPFSSDLCPIPPPFSSLVPPFAQSLPLNGGLSPAALSQSALASILAQSSFPPAFQQSALAQSAFPPAFQQSAIPPSAFSQSPLASLLSSPAFSSLLSPSARSMSPLNSFNGGSYPTDSLTPILVDFPPLPYSNDYQQAPRYFPFTRSATEKV